MGAPQPIFTRHKIVCLKRRKADAGCDPRDNQLTNAVSGSNRYFHASGVCVEQPGVADAHLFVPTPETALDGLLALRRQMRGARQTPDGMVHALPSETERVLEATSDCLASLFERVAALELSQASKLMAAAGNSSTPPLAEK